LLNFWAGELGKIKRLGPDISDLNVQTPADCSLPG
jgi:hypothetical protein